MLRRTRIVATLGPATDRPGVLEGMLDAGLDVVRVNFSHGTVEEHRARIGRLRQAAQDRQRLVAVLADLPGPKLRNLLADPITLAAGAEVAFAGSAAAGTDIPITEPEVLRDVQLGHRILLDDGRLQLRAVRGTADRLVAMVEVGGTLLPKKGVNLPDTPLSLPALTPRDRSSLEVAAQVGVDWLALSFVREPEAAQQLREAAWAHGLEVPVLAKIERPEAIKRAREIVEAFDGIMVARGDLGVEMPLERVPRLQKRLINLARYAGKPVITATDMLDSMRTQPRPTRAEASDVANAIYDGTDAVMLSGETSVGEYPVEAVACMDRIARETEPHLGDDEGRDLFVPRGRIEDHISHLTSTLAREVNAQAIVAPTYSGRMPRLIARHRPQVPIVAPSRHESVLRRLKLVWGLVPIPLPPSQHMNEDRLATAVHAAFEHHVLREGDLAVVLAGQLVEGGERFPTIRVVRVGEDGRSLTPL